MTLERACFPRAPRANQVDRLHELKPRRREARTDSQIAIALAVCELVFIALLNEIVEFSAGWSLHIQNSDQKSQAVYTAGMVQRALLRSMSFSNKEFNHSAPHAHCLHQIHHLAERREFLTKITPRRSDTQRRYAHTLIGSDSFAHHLVAAQQIRLDDQL